MLPDDDDGIPDSPSSYDNSLRERMAIGKKHRSKFPSNDSMIALAKEVGFPETCFVKFDRQTFVHDIPIYDAKWFTPTSEIDFCGHATVCTFGILADLGEIDAGKKYIQRCNAGELAVEVVDDSVVGGTDTLQTNSDNSESQFPLVIMEQALPVFEKFEALQEMMEVLGISELPNFVGAPETVSTGGRDLMIPMEPEIIDSLNVTSDVESPGLMAGIEKISVEHNLVAFHIFGWRNEWTGPVSDVPLNNTNSLDAENNKVFSFAGQTVVISANQPNNPKKFVPLSDLAFETSPIEINSVRNFGPAVGVPEEPATGSANGALACFIVQRAWLDRQEVMDEIEKHVLSYSASLNLPSLEESLYSYCNGRRPDCSGDNDTNSAPPIDIQKLLDNPHLSNDDIGNILESHNLHSLNDKNKDIKLKFNFKIEQGRTMGEPSIVFANIVVSLKTRRIVDVRVGGHVKVVGSFQEYLDSGGK